ncbi:DUF4344 domain-containing metallopeptidase [Streptomyces sp. NPDC051243]|uniref:DUF4344 domain-containing metallopeptidase n=1 Tax=Streptomyces sp. NPDC051243 TaxID=3365646 RepID=UPI00378C37D7
MRPVRATAAASPSPSVGQGDLVVSYEKPQKAADRRTEEFLKRTEVLEGVASHADDIVALPYDVPLRAKSCGEANAFWKRYAIDTINAWGGLAQADAAGGIPDSAYADEHSLDIQRFYNWSCRLYGSNPDAYKEIVRSDGNPDGVLPEERAERCPDEFAKFEHAWATLLESYLKA